MQVLQTPNLPKKLDKFGNYVQQNFKLADDKVCSVFGHVFHEVLCVLLVCNHQIKKELWEFTQKMRATK